MAIREEPHNYSFNHTYVTLTSANEANKTFKLELTNQIP